MPDTEVLDVALAAARGAAVVHRKHLGSVAVRDWSEKGASDFVTHVDREAESVVLDLVRSHYPEHAMLAEEETSERTAASEVLTDELPDRGWTWIIDPLDGTTNFLHGYPMYAVSVGVAFGHELRAAVVLNSATGDEWTAVRGGGARLNGEPVSVSRIETLDRSLIGTGFPFKALHLMPEYTVQLDRVLRASSGVRRAGSAALDLCHLATGWFDGFWEMTLAPWDVAAGALIVREAGGRVTRFDGSENIVGHGTVLAGNPTIHRLLGQVLRERSTMSSTGMQ